MRTLIAIIGSVVFNFGALGVMDWSVHQEQMAPAGVVLVQQLPEVTAPSVYAQQTHDDVVQSVVR
jgi:hypothetical protein